MPSNEELIATFTEKLSSRKLTRRDNLFFDETDTPVGYVDYTYEQMPDGGIKETPQGVLPIFEIFERGSSKIIFRTLLNIKVTSSKHIAFPFCECADGSRFKSVKLALDHSAPPENASKTSFLTRNNRG